MAEVCVIRFEKSLWLMPLAFAAHIAEEYFGGFSKWVSTQMHGSMSNAMFLVNNAVFMAVLVGLVGWAAMSRSRLSAFLCMCWTSGNLFWDFWVHLLTTVWQGVYSPGLLTAALFYYPLPLFIARWAIVDRRMRRADVAAAFVVGMGLMGFVMWAGLWHFHRPIG